MSELAINQVIDMQERGLHYGDGLFETLLKLDNSLPLWGDHYDRLRRGCDRLQISLPAEKWLLQKIDAETEGHDSAVIKVIVTRGKGGRGLELPQNNHASTFILKYPYIDIDQQKLEIDVSICQTRLPINPNLAGIKHLTRLDYVLAAIELANKGNKNEAILCDTDGYIVEGIVSNLFFCLDEEVFTPSLEFAGVEGIMRKQIIKYLMEQSIEVKIGRYYPELLLKANECFVCNSVQGVRPIRSIDDTEFSTGTVTRMLISALNLSRMARPEVST